MYICIPRDNIHNMYILMYEHRRCLITERGGRGKKLGTYLAHPQM